MFLKWAALGIFLVAIVLAIGFATSHHALFYSEFRAKNTSWVNYSFLAGICLLMAIAAYKSRIKQTTCSHDIWTRQVETTEHFLKTTPLSKAAREAVKQSSELGNIAKFMPLFDVEDYYDTVEVEYTLPLTKFVAQTPEFWGGPEFEKKANELARTTFRKECLLPFR